MATSIPLSKPMQKFVAEQAAARGLKDDKAFVNQLLKEEQLRIAKQYLIERLEEGSASGYHEVTEERWEESRKRLKAQFQAKKRAKAK